MDEVFKLVSTQLQEASEAITGLEGRVEEGRQETRDLRDIAVIMQDINERQAEELAAAHTRILTLEHMLAESQAREANRDKRMEELTEVVRSLQRKLEDPPGNL
jgi:chromosome segregation ATPase